jgi:hypothetical protein
VLLLGSASCVSLIPAPEIRPWRSTCSSRAFASRPYHLVGGDASGTSRALYQVRDRPCSVYISGSSVRSTGVAHLRLTRRSHEGIAAQYLAPRSRDQLSGPQCSSVERQTDPRDGSCCASDWQPQLVPAVGQSEGCWARALGFAPRRGCRRQAAAPSVSGGTRLRTRLLRQPHTCKVGEKQSRGGGGISSGGGSGSTGSTRWAHRRRGGKLLLSIVPNLGATSSSDGGLAHGERPHSVGRPCGRSSSPHGSGSPRGHYISVTVPDRHGRGQEV